ASATTMPTTPCPGAPRTDSVPTTATPSSSTPPAATREPPGCRTEAPRRGGARWNADSDQRPVRNLRRHLTERREGGGDDRLSARTAADAGEDLPRRHRVPAQGNPHDV